MSEDFELLKWSLAEIEEARSRLFGVGVKLIETHLFDEISINGDELMAVCRVLEQISAKLKEDFK